MDFREAKSRRAIQDSRLSQSGFRVTERLGEYNKQHDAKLEHDLKLEDRAQSHVQAKSNKLIGAIIYQSWFSKIGSFLLILILLSFMGAAFYVLTSPQFEVSPGLGFTFGMVTAVFGHLIHTLINRIWESTDLQKYLEP